MGASYLKSAAVFVGLIPLFGQQSIDQERLPTPAQLLEQSYLVGADLVPLNRCTLLFFIANAAVDLAPDLSRKWAEELYQSTFGLPPSWNRGALQKNALAVLGRADPAKAFALMPSMDVPIENDGIIAEDLRAYLAGTLFPAYYQSKPSPQRLQEIRNQARIIGATRCVSLPRRASRPEANLDTRRCRGAGLVAGDSWVLRKRFENQKRRH